ncbi:MAG: acyltransferase, partial [Pseudomonadota bacterium]
MILNYRPDIDGLRALAVLAVVFYHAGFDIVGGGFVGVDVFFVISGYLITSIIMKDIQSADGFSIAKFYERRARRIFPALFAVIFASSIAAFFILTPLELDRFARSAIAATLFVSNIFFRYQTGYFAGDADEQPLLHTWSLAVEEQFYIFFPLFLMFVHRFLPRRISLLVLLVAIVSLAMALVGIRFSTAAAFYLAPPRAWELMLGALLALGAVPTLRWRLGRELVAIVGLAAIAWSVTRFDEATIFPGFAALLPTFGTAALIWAGMGPGTSLVNRLLSQKPLVFVGLISYSLYLWHWPLIVFHEFSVAHRPSPRELLVILAISFVLAIISWR